MPAGADWVLTAIDADAAAWPTAVAETLASAEAATLVVVVNPTEADGAVNAEAETLTVDRKPVVAVGADSDRAATLGVAEAE